MSEIEMIRNELRQVRDELRFVSSMLKAVLPDAGKNLWMSEEEVIAMLCLSKKTLQQKRKAGLIQYRYTGKQRNVQYNRKSIELYLQGNSTINKKASALTPAI